MVGLGRAVSAGGINLTINVDANPTSPVTVAGTYIVSKKQALDEIRSITIALSDTTVTNLYGITDILNAIQITLRDLTVFNPAGNATHTIDIVYSDGTVTYKVFVAELEASWFLLHTDTVGWQVYNAKGHPVEGAMSAIVDGPWRVEDATDATKYIEFDPENSQVISGGTAQPTIWNGLNYALWKPPGTAGQYTCGMLHFEDQGGGTASANVLRAIPISLPWTATYDAIALNVDTANAGGNVRVGIYNSAAATGVPGTLLLDAGTFTTDATGDHVVTFSDLVIGPGLYFLAFVTDANAGTAVYERTSTFAAHTLAVATGATSNPAQGVSVAHTYGALPDPFGAPTLITSGHPWRLKLRIA